jgi:hypothetical protein
MDGKYSKTSGRLQEHLFPTDSLEGRRDLKVLVLYG